jgi:hypothetical protein
MSASAASPADKAAEVSISYNFLNSVGMIVTKITTNRDCVPLGDGALREDIVHFALRVFAAAIALNLVVIQAAVAQQPEPAPPPPFKPQELQQLLAPIALYPDELIAQILTAATYPLEIVMAARWVADPKNAALTGDALAQALEQQSWDASVKSLAPFPGVLKMMSDKLDWTQKLGDAFLAQEQDCLAAVQTLRRKAQAAGTLKSTPQQTVTVQPPAAAAPLGGAPATMAPITEEPTIAIEPADPSQVYVPYYDPSTAYGAWPYPDYQPYAFPPPPVGYGLAAGIVGGLAFGAGVAVTRSLWGWGRPNWGGGSIAINTGQYNRINLNRNVVAGNTWQHNAVHRQGVAYRDTATGQRYGRATAGAGAAARQNYRGYAGQGAGAAAAGRTGGVAGVAGGRAGGVAGAAGGRAGGVAGAAQNRPAAQNRVAAANPGGQGRAARPNAGQAGRPQAPAQRPNIAASRGAGGGGAAQRSAFNPGNGAQTRAYAQRGAASRQQAAGRAQGGGGGGARGGGGGARGGGGGRGRR